MYFYEMIIIEPICGWNEYCYFFTDKHFPVRSKKNCKPIPDKLRILIEDRECWISEIKVINVFQYFYRKYFKKKASFLFGYRYNWEREKI